MDWSPFIDSQGIDRLEYEALLPLYEQALERDVEDLEALSWLGHAYTRLGRHQEGLEVDLRLTGALPRDATARYNLACSYALLGRIDEAFLALEEALRLGYRDGDHMRSDEDLAAVRDDPRFAELLRRMG